MSEDIEVVVIRVIPAPRQKVFEAWLTEKALRQFMRPMVGMEAPKVEVDPREGGGFSILMRAGDQELPHRGTYRTINRYERIVFSWLSHATTPDSLVTLDFRELSPRETELSLRHVGLPGAEGCGQHKKGWTTILESLRDHLIADAD